MELISREEIIQRIRVENPWWITNTVGEQQRGWKPRAYFELFFPLVNSESIRRAIVLMGPRRVGKTVMLYHTVQALIGQGISAKSICYFSVDHPIFSGLRLERLLDSYSE